ncbi:melatonin receptor type 1B-A-like [Patiria miniata]|uniref:G-protein coupled receptors family 1 profile domain-containing protein n=1 Tax=Patiria miniata TaxID=46514 RepID=A0A914AN91_PATMI|nr:melatonin receptor type 1B-A-like [Patiria miniata]
MAENVSEVTTVGSWFTTEEIPPSVPNAFTMRVVVGIIYLIIAVVGTLGNTLVITAVLLSNKLRTATNAFVVNLSLADLLTSLVIYLQAAVIYSRDGPAGGDWVCSLATIIIITTVGCSIMTLASVSLNRYLLITRPAVTYRAIFTAKKITVWLVLVWLVPLLVVLLPPLLGVGALGFNRMYHHCGFIDHPLARVFNIVIAAVLYPVPLVTIIACYVGIWRHLRHHAKRISASNEPDESSGNKVTDEEKGGVANDNTQSADSARFARSVSKALMMNRRQNEITKNMFYIVCAFLVCQSPWLVCLLLNGAGPAVPYAIAILFFNSCLNPMIYANKHRDFKAVFGCILRCRWDQIPEPSEFMKALKRRACCTRG